MAITWTPILTDFDDIYWPDATTYNISAVSDDELAISTVYTLDSQDFPITSNFTVSGSGVVISGDSLSIFLGGNPILYLEGGDVNKKRSTIDPDDLVKGDDLYSWKGDTRTDETVTVTISVDILDAGSESLETDTITYTLKINNSWDGHKTAVDNLMGKLY